MKYFFPLLLICTLLCCCKKEDQPYRPIQLCTGITRNIDSINEYIHGTWEWREKKIFSRELGGYYYLTPQTQGYSISLKLSNDTAKFYVNNQPDSVYRFLILREKDLTTMPEDSLPIIVYYSFYTGLIQSYFRVRICSTFLVTEESYRGDIAGDDIWEKK